MSTADNNCGGCQTPPIDVTNCQCKAAGFCSMFGFTMTAREFELCQTQERYRQLWADGNSPQHQREVHMIGTGPRQSCGLGDTIAWLIKLVTFGRLRMCDGCESRRAWLNKKFPYRWRETR